jgi:hypothetical protein
MTDNKRSGSRRKSQLSQKTPSPETKGFRPGSGGVCEAQLWEFTGPTRSLADDEEIPVERVAAASLDQALKYMRRRHYDFAVCKAETIGMIAMLSGSPLD